MPGDWAPIPRFLLAALIWLLPGWALARALFRDRDPLARASFAGAAAIAASTLLAFIAYLLHVSAGRLHLGLWGAAAVAAVVLLLTARRSGGNSVADEGDPAPALLTRIAAYVSLGVLAAAGLRGGATMRFTGDGPDHVGTIREILASGSFFPTEAFHVGAGILGADPRKGLLHPVYAALCTISGLDPVDLWTLLPIVTAPFLFAAGYLFLRGLRVRPALSVAGAWILLLTWNHGLGSGLLSFSSVPQPGRRRDVLGRGGIAADRAHRRPAGARHGDRVRAHMRRRSPSLRSGGGPRHVPRVPRALRHPRCSPRS